MLLINFVVVCVGLAVVAAIAWIGMEKAVRDQTFKTIGQYVFIGIAVIIILYAAGAVLFNVGRMITIGPHQILDFGIGIVAVLVVLYFLHMLADMLPADIKGVKLAEAVNYFLDAIAIIAIMVIAMKAFFGGGLGIIPPDLLPRASMLIG